MKTAAVPSILVVVVLLAVAVIAEAQQPKSVPRIGYLSRDLHPSDSRAPAPRNLEAFRQGLRELGYIEGKTSSSSTGILTGEPSECPRWLRN